ncbi:AAA+ family ATPase [uncultured Albimonas sp.]|uniref:AAA+ family ATPase n=1 Tax=uncultured Albimonas sp. TaxID=1331701 RepID=UPI0030EFA5A8
MTTARTLPALALPALALALALAAPPLAAQQTPEAPAPEAQDGWLPEIPGLDEMTDAAREAIERLREQLGPALRQMRDAVAMLDDYGPPEMLPNGDILIPRREGGAEGLEDSAPDAGPQEAPKAAPDTPAPAIDL